MPPDRFSALGFFRSRQRDVSDSRGVWVVDLRLWLTIVPDVSDSSRHGYAEQTWPPAACLPLSRFWQLKTVQLSDMLMRLTAARVAVLQMLSDMIIINESRVGHSRVMQTFNKVRKISFWDVFGKFRYCDRFTHV